MPKPGISTIGGAQDVAQNVDKILLLNMIHSLVN